MLGVRMMEYSGANKGIKRAGKYETDKEPTLLVKCNDPVPDRIRRRDFVKAKSCIPEVTRFEIGEGEDAIVYVYDENSDCMVREHV